MSFDFEEIKRKSICSECGGREMVLGYSVSGGGLKNGIFKKSSFLGLDTFTFATNEIMIICRNCGVVVKSYAEYPKEL